jgi:dolichol-phosphate mannosyltransferase
MLTTAGLGLLGLSFAFSLAAIGIRIFSPTHTPPGITTLMLTICGFGALNLFAIALVGEYIAKIMTEVKGRPRLIRSELIRNGETSKLTPTGS